MKTNTYTIKFFKDLINQTTPQKKEKFVSVRDKEPRDLEDIMTALFPPLSN